MKFQTALLLSITIGLLPVTAPGAETNATKSSGASTNASAKSTEPIKVTASEAKEHVGANAIVTGMIAEVNKASALYRLNFEQPYPKNVFTAVIFGRSTNDFPEIDKLKGKKVQVTGKIAEYRGHPQIVVNNTNQIKLVEKAQDKRND